MGGHPGWVGGWRGGGGGISASSVLSAGEFKKESENHHLHCTWIHA